MLVEGLIGEELYRIKSQEYLRDTTRRNRMPIAPKPARSARRRVGDAMIRAGGRIADIRVDPCLDAAAKAQSARA